MNAAAELVPVTPKFVLDFIYYCVISIVTLAIAGTILGIVLVWKLGDAAVRPIFQLILVAQSDGLRMLTVIFLVSATTGLVILGRIDGNHAATILSGIAGYILGSGDKGRRTNDRKSTAEAHDGQV
ncbi:MAG TPA: hypothetical protein VFE33_35985 [Thermoanaerobaculia bacterium]|nr:hypothetical protein [Thermoanaerobaculia bacterium]